MNKILFLFLFPSLVFSQSLYNPQLMYDQPGGMFEEDSLRSIYLNFYDNNYHSYLVNAWFYNPDERIPAVLTLNGVDYDSVGVRYKGNSTFCLPNDDNNPKVPYNIDINYFIGGQKLLGYKKLKLANSWMDATFLKQIISSNIYRKYLPTGESNLVRLYVQGNYNGLYVNDESINKQFLEKHFDEKSGPLFKCDNIERFCDTLNAPQAMPPNLYYMGNDTTLYYDSYDIKSDYGWEDLVSLIRTINLSFQTIDSVLNVDRVLWAFAVNQVVANLDCYNTYYIHNYYLYKTEDGLFQMIPWDLDNSFVGAIMGWDYWSPSNVYEYDPYFTGPNLGAPTQPWEERPLLYNLLNDNFYRKIYTAHMRTIISESLDTSYIRGNINQLHNLSYTAASQDPYKLFTMAHYYDNVESAIWTGWGFGGIISTINERKQYLLSHPEISLIPPIITTPNVSMNNLVTVEVSNSNYVELMATTSKYNSKFKSFEMYDDGVSGGDVIANDGIYSCFMPFLNKDSVKFYIRAHNDNAIKLSPERAEYEFYIHYNSNFNNVLSFENNNKIVRRIDILGRDVTFDKNLKNKIFFNLYEDGNVKKIYKIE